MVLFDFSRKLYCSPNNNAARIIAGIIDYQLVVEAVNKRAALPGIIGSSITGIQFNIPTCYLQPVTFGDEVRTIEFYISISHVPAPFIMVDETTQTNKEMHL
jgi:hypothetical protein